MKTKFKVGDVVLVRKDKEEFYSPIKLMSKAKRLGVVTSVVEDGQGYPYLVFTVGDEGGDHYWVYEESELKLVESYADVLFRAYGIGKEQDVD